MDEIEIKIIEAKFQAALQQRDQANNQCINMVGELARKQLEIDRLTEELSLINKVE